MSWQKRKFDFAIRFAPEEFWRRVTSTSDERKIAFFAPTGFEGSRRFLYDVNGSEIKVRLRQRRKGFPPILTMKIKPTNYGCRIYGDISVELSSWIFLLIFTIVFLIIGGVNAFPVFEKVFAGEPLTNFTPFNFFGLLFLFNAVTMPFIFILNARRDEDEIFQWIKSLVDDQIVRPAKLAH